MKPAPFDYHAPRSLAEATTLLAELADDDPKCIAGGQSLVPMMNLRLARPGHLVDLRHVPDLRGIHREGRSWRIGALTRHAAIEDDAQVRQDLPLLTEVAGNIGYRAVRNRGTIGGSVCHADPVAEWPMIACLLDAELEVVGPRGDRRVPAADFFVMTLESALHADEVLTHLRFTLPPDRWGWGFGEFARKVGDYAVVAAGVLLEAADGAIGHARIALAGVAGTPLRAHGAEQRLAGAALHDASALTAAAEAAASEIDPPDDLHASSVHRRQLVRTLVQRALVDASGRVAGDR